MSIYPFKGFHTHTPNMEQHYARQIAQITAAANEAFVDWLLYAVSSHQENPYAHARLKEKEVAASIAINEMASTGLLGTNYIHHFFTDIVKPTYKGWSASQLISARQHLRIFTAFENYSADDAIDKRVTALIEKLLNMPLPEEQTTLQLEEVLMKVTAAYIASNAEDETNLCQTVDAMIKSFDFGRPEKKNTLFLRLSLYGILRADMLKDDLFTTINNTSLANATYAIEQIGDSPRAKHIVAQLLFRKEAIGVQTTAVLMFMQNVDALLKTIGRGPPSQTVLAKITDNLSAIETTGIKQSNGSPQIPASMKLFVKALLSPDLDFATQNENDVRELAEYIVHNARLGTLEEGTFLTQRFGSIIGYNSITSRMQSL